MRWPLWDEDCTRCHAGFEESDPEAWENPRFHQLGVHNVELGVDCVECHSSHQTGGDPRRFFLSANEVRVQCARCHAEFEEGGA
jgi:predicted CXXCH cytochrome family protein